MRGLCTKALEIVMDHPVWPDLPLPMSRHPDAVPTAETPVLHYPAAPWLEGLDEPEQGHQSGAVLPGEPGEQVHNENRNGIVTPVRVLADPSDQGAASMEQGGRIREVPLSRIRLSRAHRRIVKDAHSLRDLMSSIDAVELRRPLLVRPMGDGEYELVCGDRRFAAMHTLGHVIALVEIREMTDRQAAVTAFVDDQYHSRRKFWERALQIEEIRTCIAAERGVCTSAVENREILASLRIQRDPGRRPLDSLVSECLNALAVLTPAVLALAEVERDDPRLALAISRPVYREIRDAPDDRARAAIIYHAVHGHPPAWAPQADASGFDVASVISTRTTLITVVMEIAWARVPPEHVRAVRRRARAELNRLLRERPVRLSLPVLTARVGEPRIQPD